MKKTVVYWTLEALTDIENIADFISLNSSVAADKIIKNIFFRTRQIADFPESGQQQHGIKTTKIYRYLIEGNYKIIYSYTNRIIYIHTVFDCRQDPDKLVRNL